VYVDL